MKFTKPFIGKLFKRILEVGILFYLTLTFVILLTGGFKVNFLGLSLKATHLYTPLKFLLPMILVRLLFTVELQNVLLMLGSLSLTFVLAEGVLRIIDPPVAKPQMAQIHAPSPVFGWDLVPESYGVGGLGEYVYINSAGFRDTEHPREKERGTYRIMAIGDSFTFGMGVKLEDTYAKQLERILNNKGNDRWEVINCGVIGHNMWQHYEVLVRKVLPYGPNLVILGLYQDDLISSIAPYEETPGYQGEDRFSEEGVRGVLSHFSTYNLLRHVNVLFEHKYRYKRGYKYLMAIEERKKKWGPANPTNNNYKIMSGTLDKKYYLEFTTRLRDFVKTAERAGAKVLVILIPDAVQLNDSHMQFVNRHVAQASQDIGVHFLDVTPILEKEPDVKSLYLFPFDAHNSPKGLRIIAEAIAGKIVRENLLESNGEMGRNPAGQSAG